MLRREQKIRNIILFTLFSLVFIGVGYAVISSNLTLNGSMRLNKITWDVHFENFEELYDNTVTATKTLSNNNTSLTYNVNLNKPGDIFEFTIDVVNKGNIDAMLSNIGKNGLTSAQQQVMDYSVTYLDGSTPTVKDSLKIGEAETFVISVKTKANITNAQLNATDTNLSLTFNPTYAQDDNTSTKRKESLYSIMKKNAVDDNIKSSFVDSTTGIDYSAHSSDSNGKGLYTLSSTLNENYPIMFYRGNITNNNIKFGGFCWKIVRTTETGGIKLIYNGIVDDEEHCSNSTGNATEIGKSKFNSSSHSYAYSGYMYGNAYIPKQSTVSNEYKYGKSFSYDNGIYTLQDTSNDITKLSTYHYTCFSASSMCTEISYIYRLSDTTATYIELSGGINISDAIEEMTTNRYDSLIKTTIDNWFKNNIINYEKYLEDTPWCGDRTTTDPNATASFLNNGWKTGGNVWNDLRYGPLIRCEKTLIPSLKCEKNDSYTVNSNNGNKALTYPVALLNVDEIMFAGLKYSHEQLENTYLNTGNNWDTMSPGGIWSLNNDIMYVTQSGNYLNGYIYGENGVRPSISLKHGIKVSSGDGTPNNPYIIN